MGRKFLAGVVLLLICFSATTVSTLTYPPPAMASDSLNWEWLSPTLPAESLNDVVYANGLFVAVGGQGSILTSPDGEVWTERHGQTNEILGAIAYGNGRFVAAGQGVALLSDDGLTWRTVRTGVDATALIFAEGRFLLITGDKELIAFSSPDGERWTPHPIPFIAGRWAFDIAYGNGKYVTMTVPSGSAAFGGYGQVVTPFASEPSFDIPPATAVSTDGATWQPRDAVVWNNPNRLRFLNGRFFLLYGDLGKLDSFSGIVASADAQSWDLFLSKKEEIPLDMLYVNGRYILSGAIGGYLTPFIRTSADGKNWSYRRLGGPDQVIYRMAYGNGRYVGLGKRHIYTSSDGATWRPATQIPFDLHWEKLLYGEGIQDLAFGAGRYVAVGYLPERADYFAAPRGFALVSTDGRTWQQVKMDDLSVQRIIYGGGQFVAWNPKEWFEEGSSIQVSSDGLSWTTINLGTKIYDIAFGNGVFVATGEKEILRSIDGRTWSSQAPGKGPWTRVAYANGRFLVAGNQSLISTDGRTWQETRQVGPMLMSAGDRFIWLEELPRDEGYQTHISTDGRNWTPGQHLSLPRYIGMADYAWGNGRLVMLPDADEHYYYTTTDGTDWTRSARQRLASYGPFTFSNYPFTGIAFANGRHIATGKNYMVENVPPCYDRAHGASRALAAFAMGCAQYQAGGEPVQLPWPPPVVDGRMLVPIRPLANALGVANQQIKWDAATQSVTLTKDDVTLRLQVGSTRLERNGVVSTMDTAPQALPPGYVVLPARYVAEAFGYTVQWDQAAQTALVGPDALPERPVLAPILTPPGWPAGAKLQATVTGFAIQLSWPEAVATPPSSLMGYEILSGGHVVDRTAQTQLTIEESWARDLSEVIARQYQVRAFDRNGNLGPTLEVSITLDRSKLPAAIGTVDVPQDRKLITIPFSRPLDEASLPDPADFTVAYRGSQVHPTQVNVAGNIVTLQMAEPLPYSAVVTLTYRPGARALREKGGSSIPGFVRYTSTLLPSRF